MPGYSYRFTAKDSQNRVLFYFTKILRPEYDDTERWFTAFYSLQRKDFVPYDQHQLMYDSKTKKMFWVVVLTAYAALPTKLLSQIPAQATAHAKLPLLRAAGCMNLHGAIILQRRGIFPFLRHV